MEKKLENLVFRPEYSGMKSQLMNSLFFIIIGGVINYAPKPMELTMYVKNPKIYTYVALFFIFLGIIKFLKVKLTISSNKYILTDQRLTVEKGILSKKISNLELWRIVDIEMKQSAGELATGGCTIVLTTQDLSDPTLYIKGLNIAHGREIYKALTEHIANATKNSGVMRTV